MIKTKKLSFFIMFFLFSTAVFADKTPGPEPVVDVSVIDSLGMDVKNGKTVYSQLKDSYDQLQRSYEELKDLNNDVKSTFSGEYTYGRLYNDIDSSVDSWEWTANDWDSALKGLSGGNSQRYQQLQSQYKTYYPNVVSQNDYQKGSTSSEAQIYNQAVAVNQTAITQSSYQFEDINTRLKEIQDLSNQIDGASTEKESLDLNSKIAVQSTYLLAEILRMQTLVDQQIGQIQAAVLEKDVSVSQLNDETLLPTN